MQEHARLVQEHQALTRRVEALEDGRREPTLVSSPSQPKAPPMRWLSLERIGYVYVLARSLRDARGYRIDETLQRLAAAFGVEDMSDLTDDRWTEITIWLNKQWG